MREVVGFQSWIFWWAALTSTVFLQDGLHRVAGFFRDRTVFSKSSVPFNVVSGITGVIDSAANWLQQQANFNPNQSLLNLGPISIQNWMVAILFALILIGFTVRMYRRALVSPGLSDDLVALVTLYFVIRIIAHLISIARIAPLTPAGRALLDNPVLTFTILMLVILSLVFFGEGLKNRIAFWRGIFEGLILWILLFPSEAGGLVAAGLDSFADFANILRTNLLLGLFWGVLGMFLALRRLYRNGGAPAKGKA